MKIRTQLILAFLILAVVPLAGIVAYSYASSQRALRQAVEAETAALTSEMEARMVSVREDLTRRVERIGDYAFRRWPAAEEGRSALGDTILDEMGDAAALVDTFEFQPLQPAGTAPAAPPAPPPPAFVLKMSELVHQVEERIGAELENVDLSGIEFDGLDEEEARRRLLENARAGVHAATVIVEGIGMLSEVLGGDGDESAPAAGEAAEAPVVIAGDEVPRGDARGAWEERFERWAMEWESAVESDEQEVEIAAETRAEPEGSLTRSWRGADGFSVPVRERGEVVGEVRARISGDQVLRGVLERTRRDQGEVPFAIDDAGELYTLDEAERDRLDDLLFDDESEAREDNWVVARTRDPASGVTFGIARPIGESLEEIRSAAARNLAYGLGLIALALVGILPLSTRMTRSLEQLHAGAERIAAGDLDAEVPVRSRNEIGKLAASFNHMARELKTNQGKLLEEERRRRDQEIEKKLLQSEYNRKSEELEDARRFQLSLLPRELPEHPTFELAVHMQTATEVGGDYYDFQLDPEGALTAVIGDATGHGARAGTMVTVIKSLFSAHPPSHGLSGFLEEAAAAIRRMELGRMAMALTLVRLDSGRLTLSAAGMPPALVHRAASGEIDELVVEGMPLGSLGSGYREMATEVAAGDSVLLMSDGFPELPNRAGDPLGYSRARDAFWRVAERPPREVIAGLLESAAEWSGGGPPNDDVTFVVLRVR